MRLTDKVVWITDADSPSGQALLLRMAAEGASLLLSSASGGKGIEAQLARVRQAGTKAFVAAADLTRSSETERMLDEAARELGPVDVLVHNGNRVVPISVESGEETAFLDVMNANAKTAFVCAKAAGKRMEARRSGKIVFVGSIHAEKPTGSSFAYSASKAAVKMLAREASVVLGRHGISVHSIEFGPVEGDDETFRSELSLLYDSYRYKVPSGVLGTHEDLAELVTFLSSDDARYLNGADIRMDGGFLMHYLDFKTNKPQTAGDAS
ncbi:SDR family NAD(P)-dependent oxidoreductase [Cohnella thermotolerans]|uniref:SDR family NAD(P)-dependent oxidoreductase n=1 Tax=Cohnella thermotolerans TaxID=329858 RepID=UPI0004176029|nr:SDR family oxidoreductase [Cohnella thermotolerans]